MNAATFELELGLGLVLFEQLVRALEDLVDRVLEVAVLADVAEELLREQLLAGIQIEHARLVAQVVDQILAFDGHRLDVFARVAVRAARHPVLGAVLQQDVLPVGPVLRLCFLLGLLLLLGGGRLDFLFRLHHLEERIAQQLLLQVLLQIEQRHVEQIHRLIQARIDAQVLPHADVLMQAGLHAAGDRRARRRVVSVGPR